MTRISDFFLDIKAYFKYDFKWQKVFEFFFDRVLSFFICVIWAIIAIYSPKKLEGIIIDASERIKKVP